MTIKHAAQPTGKFTRVANDNFGKSGMPMEAEYVHLYLMSKPAHWVVRIHDIATVFHISERTARRRMAEIVQAGYARRLAITSQGRRGIKMWDYEVHQEPVFRAAKGSKSASNDRVTDGRHRKTEGYQQDVMGVMGVMDVERKEEEFAAMHLRISPAEGRA